MSQPNTNDRLQGTLDLLILKTLSLGPQHGWGVAQRIQQTSKNLLQINQGSLYPALHRLEERGLVTARWAKGETGRRVRVYALTAAGRKRLAEQKRDWSTFAKAVSRLVRVD